MLVVLGMVLVGVISISLTLVLLAVFEAPEDIVRIVAPFGGTVPPLVAGAFGIIKYIQRLEQRQERMHRTNVREIEQTRTAAQEAASTAREAIEYHKEEERKRDADIFDGG
jgi:hypothetical protein